MTERERVNQTQSIAEQLSKEAKRLRAEARLLPPGVVRDALIRKARHAETGCHINQWLSSPGLQPPK